jgi:hypothetical protein
LKGSRDTLHADVYTALLTKQQTNMHMEQWRTQEIAKGGHFRGHEKLTTFFLFLGNYHLSTFFGERQLDDLFLLTDPNPTSIRVSESERGSICPSTCFLVFLKPSKIIFRQPKGGHGHMETYSSSHAAGITHYQLF